MRTPAHLTCAALVLSVLAACTSEPAEPGPEPAPRTDTAAAEPSPGTDTGTPTGPRPPQTGQPPRPTVAGTIASGLDVPWGIAFLPDGSALVSERDTGRILNVRPDGALSTVGVVPGVTPTSEGGLLGLAVSPNYRDDQLIYAYLTTAADNRVVEIRYDGQQLGRPRPLLTGIPRGEVHNGGRIAFGPDGLLYVATGETGDGELAPDLGSLGGKILRVTPEGEPAPGIADPDSPVWSFGHRNVQGLAFDDDGRLWASEFGSSLWDELNLIEGGGDYGWPAAEGRSDLPRVTDPLAQWPTPEASPSGLAYAEGTLWMASLIGNRLWRIDVDGDRVVGEPAAFFVGEYGRLRTVVKAPDGSLWLTTSNTDGRGDPAPNDDRILRVTLD